MTTVLNPKIVSDGGNPQVDVRVFFSGAPGANAVILDVEFARTTVFPGNFSGSAFKARTAATASTTITVQKNGAAVGTIVFGAGGTVATFTSSSGAPVTFNQGDYMSLVAPAVADTTLANLRGVLAGSL